MNCGDGGFMKKNFGDIDSKGAIAVFLFNLNLCVASIGGLSYLFGWLLGIPISMLIVPYGESLWWIILIVMIFVCLLAFRWRKRGFLLAHPRLHEKNFYNAGHGIMAIGNVVVVGGIAYYWRTAMINREEEYWFGQLMTSVIGPAGIALIGLGLSLILLPRLFRGADIS